jgi:hypothetical protein
MIQRLSPYRFSAISFIIALVLVLSGLFRGPDPARADETVVRGVLFWSESHSRCHEVMEEHFPSLEEQLGRQLEMRTIEPSDPEHCEVWLQALVGQV